MLTITNLIRVLPEGRPLSPATWEQRHRIITGILFAHALLLPLVALNNQRGVQHAALAFALIFGAGLAASWKRLHYRWRSMMTCGGLFMASVFLVHLTGGYIEMHFHFFVVVAVIAFYQDWVPFLFGVGLTVLHHGVVGVLFPHSVYNHVAAWEHPWQWALIHGAFLLAECMALVVFWKLHEIVDRDLVKARDQAWEAARVKSEFLATMSHEIRTPLNGVIGMTTLLLDSALTREQRQDAEVICQSGQHLLELVNDILDFSKLEAGKVELEVNEFELRMLVEEAVGLFAEGAKRRGLQLSVVIAQDVPDVIKSDKTRLRQVLLNLVGNAIKFTEAGRILVNINRVPPSKKETIRLRFEIIDTGIGLKTGQCERLFQAFTQADSSTSRQHEGTGLGLAICKQVVERMGGEIGVTSIWGQGSTFWFVLPFETTAPSHEQLKPMTTRVAFQGTEPGRPAKVLLVEDNPVSIKVAERLLRNLGCQVEVARTGREAVMAVTKNQYDLILMDCQLPELDGFEATRRIRQLGGLYARIPIVAMTADTLKGDRERCLDAGMSEYMTKPVTMASLQQALMHWLSWVQADGRQQPVLTYGAGKS